MTPKSKPVLAIVGRPNVGKSTLFNRLVGKRSAIVEDRPGVTRDRNYALVSYQEYEFILIDTGGFESKAETEVMIQMRQQSKFAVEEADAVIFLVDVKDGWTPGDEDIYRYLIQSTKNIYLVVNKVDNPKQEQNSYEFYSAGIEKIYPISVEHNIGVRDLFSEINKDIPLTPIPSPENSLEISVAVIGKPNAGKSSLVNAILGEERMVVDVVAGTTRDPIDSSFVYKDQKFLLIDTAGIKRKGKVKQKIETFSIVSALRSISRADVVILVVDVIDGVTEQVKKVASYACDRNKAIVIVANKKDLLEKKTRIKEVEEEIYEKLNFIDYAPLVMVSAKENSNIPRVLNAVKKVYQQYIRRIQTSDLNSILEIIVNKHSPPSKMNRPTRIYYGSQVAVSPPTFVLMTNNPDKIDPAYERYVVNQFRHYFKFEGTSLKIIWRKRKSNKK